MISFLTHNIYKKQLNLNKENKIKNYNVFGTHLFSE